MRLEDRENVFLLRDDGLAEEKPAPDLACLPLDIAEIVPGPAGIDTLALEASKRGLGPAGNLVAAG